MYVGPLEGPAKRASLHDRHPEGEPRHSLRYCVFCYRPFGIDVLTSTQCCGRGGVMAAAGTLEEMELLIVELLIEREK